MKKHNTFIFILALFAVLLSAQNLNAQQDQYLPYAEVMPQPVGGLEAIYSKISYPDIAKKNGIEGKVYLLVYVNQNGGVDDVKVVKGIGAGCDEAAIDGVKQMKFTVGKNQGAAVKVKLSLSIVFKLNA